MAVAAVVTHNRYVGPIVRGESSPLQEPQLRRRPRVVAGRKEGDDRVIRVLAKHNRRQRIQFAALDVYPQQRLQTAATGHWKIEARADGWLTKLVGALTVRKSAQTINAKMETLASLPETGVRAFQNPFRKTKPCPHSPAACGMSTALKIRDMGCGIYIYTRRKKYNGIYIYPRSMVT